MVVQAADGGDAGGHLTLTCTRLALLWQGQRVGREGDAPSRGRSPQPGPPAAPESQVRSCVWCVSAWRGVSVVVWLA